ncbi:MAG: JDVT-CTERM system glutamic-type intramembrane protease [Gammaproteobacteria bacterium]|jgi:uncharacterized protein
MTPIAPVARALLRDPQLFIVIAGSILAGVLLWWWLPSGFARHIATDPLRLASLLLLYPLVEEWVFRGVLQGALLGHAWGRRRRLGISLANLLSSLAFMLLHLVNQPPLWALSVIVPSLVLGHFRERHDSLLPPMLLHPLFNLTYVVAGLGWG